MSGVIRIYYRRSLLGQTHSYGCRTTTGRWYSQTRPALEDEAVAKKDKDVNLREVSLEYNRRRASYKRQVSKIRKDYMNEYQRNKAEDMALRDAEEAETTRRRLERQRAKNERSVQNAIRQEELRRQTHLAFQDHLKSQQEKRENEKELFTKARQLIIDELEEEAPLWLTTPEEVDAAFTPEAEQLLWARPQGTLGVPNPSLDSHFWQFECHTWDMSKTYKTQKDILLEEFDEKAYEETNVDPNFWTPDRVQAREELEHKAQLRANVRLEGRKALLKRQKEFLDEEGETPDGEPPRPMPVPSLGVLGNINAQEQEGSEMLLKDPTKFFVFDRNATITRSEGTESETYSGPSLGAPVALKDPLRSGSPQGRVFPQGIGKLPKPDMRSEKEKKRQEREEKLWAAAQAQARSEMDEIDLAADEDMEFRGEPLNYDDNDDWDSDDEEWVKGLDPDRDADIINVPREYRYREEDIDWVIQKLENKANQMQSHVQNTIDSLEQEARSRRGLNDEENDTQEAPFFDETTVKMLESVGADASRFETLMSSLSQDQLLALFALEADRRKSGEESDKSHFEDIPGLSEEQIAGLQELESLLKRAEEENS